MFPPVFAAMGSAMSKGGGGGGGGGSLPKMNVAQYMMKNVPMASPPYIAPPAGGAFGAGVGLSNPGAQGAQFMPPPGPPQGGAQFNVAPPGTPAGAAAAAQQPRVPLWRRLLGTQAQQGRPNFGRGLSSAAQYWLNQQGPTP